MISKSGCIIERKIEGLIEGWKRDAWEKYRDGKTWARLANRYFPSRIDL